MNVKDNSVLDEKSQEFIGNSSVHKYGKNWTSPSEFSKYFFLRATIYVMQEKRNISFYYIKLKTKHISIF